MADLARAPVDERADLAALLAERFPTVPPGDRRVSNQRRAASVRRASNSRTGGTAP